VTARAAADRALVAAVRRRLAAAADPGRAPAMQAYMKSAMPFLGVALPRVREVVTAAAGEHPPASVERLAATAAALWRGATHREHRYAAAALTGLRMADGSPALLPLYEEMVVTGAWWDHVDAVAPRLGRLLAAYPDTVRPLLLGWSTAPDRWLRRASIIAQLGARERTDTDLLARVVDANAADRDVFVRKAIGWALRDLGRTDPDWVRRFVAARADALSPLSRREALKHLAQTSRRPNARAARPPTTSSQTATQPR
jgi:3-methyladenine DNA glycosylase AlkD